VCIGLMNELRDDLLAARVMVGGNVRPPMAFHEILVARTAGRNLP
jgi:hypothetical protein